ncbi:MAG: hypothetical protein WCH07_09025 [Deltaproteobacteria bacterium]
MNWGQPLILGHAALTPEEKQNFIIAMNNLKQTIEDTLAAATEEKPGKIRVKIEGVLVISLIIAIC